MIHKELNQSDDAIVDRTLEVIGEADRFNKWIYDTIKPFCGGRILEVGSGLGNISKFFLFDNLQITLSDYNQTFCDKLKIKFSGFKNLENIVNLDLSDQEFDMKFKTYLNSFDTVFALNVIEHIEDDHLAIENSYKLLKKGGRFIILVPAYQILYNNFDKQLGHFRRYKLENITEKLTNKGFRIIRKQYFNFIGLLGWFVSGKIQKNKSIPQNQMRLYNLLVPGSKLVDKLIMNSSGLSIIAVGEK